MYRMFFSLLLTGGLIFLLAIQAGAGRRETGIAAVDYRAEMVQLIRDIQAYAREKRPGFGILPNGGLALYQSSSLSEYVDGILVESVFYRWEFGEAEDGTGNFRKTAEADRQAFADALKAPRSAGLPVFNIDYCKGREAWQDALRQNGEHGYVSYAAPRRELDVIPHAPLPYRNEEDCLKLARAKNFLVLLNPGRFAGRQEYLEALANTDYDLLVVDAYYGSESLGPEEVAKLQRKGNGARRQVYAYMSIGEAEDYRAYWQSSWKDNLPDWMETPNADWAGSYHVRFWRQEWKDILYGSPQGYLDRILAAGFDGVFLDVVDAYAYFEDEAAEG